MIYLLSISGGKDSEALLAWAKRTGLTPRRNISCNTGWEADFEGARWRDFIAELVLASGEDIKIVEADVLFAERVEAHKTFPGRLNRRWCTEELKLEPFKVEVDRVREETGDDVTVVLGIRAEESDERAQLSEREWERFL